MEGDFNQGAGIWVRSADRVRVVHNQVSNGTNYGIQIGTVFDQTSQQKGGVDTAIVQGNLISNYARGLWIEDSTHVQVTGNSFRGLTFEGILLQTSAASQTVSAYLMGNQVSDNGDVGIKETGSGTFDTHYLFNDLRNNSGGAFAGVNNNATRVGNLGTEEYIQRHITASATWDPGLLNHGATQSTTVTVNGAQIGDMIAVGFTTPIPAGALLTGSVTAANQVTVTLFNLTGASFDLAPGTLSINLWRP